MSEAKHTPGPLADLFERLKTDQRIEKRHIDKAERVALEMLEALEAIAEQLYVENEEEGWRWTGPREMHERARAAIAKAKGESRG